MSRTLENKAPEASDVDANAIAADECDIRFGVYATLPNVCTDTVNSISGDVGGHEC